MTKIDALYARYSSHAQDDGTTIENQIEYCERAAGGPCTHYIDKAKTGRAVGGRDRLLALIADAEAGKIKRVFVWKFSRIGRNLAESAGVIQELEDHGVEVASATEGSDPFARAIFLAMAEHYSRELSQNTRDGHRKRHEQRGWNGGVAPYGYRVVRNGEGRPQLQVDPDEAQVVRLIFDLYLSESIGFKKIADRLNTRGISTRNPERKNRLTRRLWSPTTIKAMVSNPIYVGEVRYGLRTMKLNRKTGRKIARFNDPAGVPKYDDAALAIIDRADFDRLQQIMRTRAPTAKNRVGGRSTWPFSGFLFCSECGSVYYSRLSKNHKGKYRYYTCGCRMSHGPNACPNSGTVREDKLLETIAQAVGEVFADADDFITAALQEAEKLAAVNRTEADDLRARIITIERRRQSLADRLRDPEVPTEAARAIYRELASDEIELERLQKAVADLGERANVNTERLAVEVREAFKQVKARFTDLYTPEQMNRFVADFIGPMTIHPDGRAIPQCKETPAEAEVSMVDIAGGGFEPPTSGL